MPQLSRFICNICQIKKNDIVLDPFCGTCGLLIEAFFLEAKIVGVDIKIDILKGAKKNIDYYKKNNSLNTSYNLILGDSKVLPFPNNYFDSIITDFPYGQSTIIGGSSINELYSKSIYEIYRVLKKNK